MRLATPQSAILSAVIFNALIIIALIPLALRGVKYRALGAGALLRRNLLDLRPGRHRGAVRGHQGDRPAAGHAGAVVKAHCARFCAGARVACQAARPRPSGTSVRRAASAVTVASDVAMQHPCAAVSPRIPSHRTAM